MQDTAVGRLSMRFYRMYEYEYPRRPFMYGGGVVVEKFAGDAIKRDQNRTDQKGRGIEIPGTLADAAPPQRVL